ncbi:gamma-glutamyl kinase [Candidatus Omnitrophus magneticus]|uniref:Gamma-glutamyl kinase n=1 Tax=Candidatus Omnitrophus magneticus TaxID=1609969 RepID=A0A0F0CRJ5_9BACT|nr:gamma-glutamyl kinase [Candidatus Omnitrophus magneticus]
MEQTSLLLAKGIEVIIVSSGAIGGGLGILGISRKNKSLSELQAIASIGQPYLMNIYSTLFQKKGYKTGQILLTQEDFNDRKRFLNIRYTLNTLFQYKAVPIINENDSVSNEEIKFGDNDRLSSLVADISVSDMLIILTDVEGVYDDNGKVIPRVEIDEDIKKYCKGKGSEESTGGMATKAKSVLSAARAGIDAVIAPGRRENVILDIVYGREIGTFFPACDNKITARKRWIAYSIKPKGRIIIDDGAVLAVRDKKKSLLPSGVLKVEGMFSEGSVVEIVSKNNQVVARGLINYSSEIIDQIKGCQSLAIEKLLGFKDYDELVHRDNLVVVE